MLGPFHVDGAPLRALGDTICMDGKGLPCHVSGRVTDVDGQPLAGASLDIWQTNADGFYDVQQPEVQPEMNLRGRFVTDSDGRYAFRTVKPVSYPVPTDGPVGEILGHMGRHAWRPAHIHFIASKSGYRRLVTHIFAHDDPWIDSDAVFGVKESLLVEFREHDDPRAGARPRRGVALLHRRVRHPDGPGGLMRETREPQPRAGRPDAEHPRR